MKWRSQDVQVGKREIRTSLRCDVSPILYSLPLFIPSPPPPPPPPPPSPSLSSFFLVFFFFFFFFSPPPPPPPPPPSISLARSLDFVCTNFRFLAILVFIFFSFLLSSFFLSFFPIRLYSAAKRLTPLSWLTWGTFSSRPSRARGILRCARDVQVTFTSLTRSKAPIRTGWLTKNNQRGEQNEMQRHLLLFLILLPS